MKNINTFCSYIYEFLQSFTDFFILREVLEYLLIQIDK